MTRLSPPAFLLLALLFITPTCSAQSDATFGTGVHHYFRGQYQDAISNFDQAILLDPSDARAFYFRGLAKDAEYGCGSGEPDWRQGAFMEIRKSGNPTSVVNRSLERIQGCRRLAIEKIRQEAKFSHEIAKRLPPPITSPVMYGEMIDVNSIVPIIQHHVPIPRPVPDSIAQPGSMPEPDDVPFQKLPKDSRPDSREVIPTEATPQRELNSPDEILDPASDADPFSTSIIEPEQTETIESDPFGS